MKNKTSMVLYISLIIAVLINVLHADGPKNPQSIDDLAKPMPAADNKADNKDSDDPFDDLNDDDDEDDDDLNDDLEDDDEDDEEFKYLDETEERNIENVVEGNGGYPERVHPDQDKNADVRETFIKSKSVAQLESKNYNRPLYEPGCPTDWRLWVALYVNNEPLARDMLDKYPDDTMKNTSMINAVGVNTEQDCQSSVLSLAIEKGYDNITAAILNKAFVDVNIEGYQTYDGKRFGHGETPLLTAINSNNKKAVLGLLKHPKIDVSMKINGATAIKHAIKENNQQMVSVIQTEMCYFIEHAAEVEKKKRKQFIEHIPFTKRCKAFHNLPFGDGKGGDKKPDSDKKPNGGGGFSWAWIFIGLLFVGGGVGFLLYVFKFSKNKKEDNQDKEVKESNEQNEEAVI